MTEMILWKYDEEDANVLCLRNTVGTWIGQDGRGFGKKKPIYARGGWKMDEMKTSG